MKVVWENEGYVTYDLIRREGRLWSRRDRVVCCFLNEGEAISTMRHMTSEKPSVQWLLRKRRSP